MQENAMKATEILTQKVFLCQAGSIELAKKNYLWYKNTILLGEVVL